MKKLACLMLMFVGCSSSKPAQEPAATPPAQEQKAEAPVDVTLQSSALSGAATLTLTVVARDEIPRATARFVVPAEVKVTSGSLEQELGALKSGETRAITLSIDIPPNTAGQLAGGVDVFPTSTIKLHRSAPVIALTAAAPKSDPIQIDGESVRMAPAH